jgi:hypothetical protein
MLAIVLAAVFVFLSLLHFYWAARRGGDLTGAVPEIEGRPAFTPSRAATTAVGVVLGATAAIPLLHAGVLASPAPAWLVHAAMIGASLVLVARAIGDFRLVGFFKRVRGSRFARLDTLFYSPLCLALGAGFAALAFV